MIKKIKNKIIKINNIIEKDFYNNLQVNSYCNSLLQGILGTSYLPRTSMSLQPFALVFVLNEILLNKRKRIIECGTGISTLLMARLARLHNIDLVIDTIDEDEEWLTIIYDLIEKEDLAKYVNFIHAPILSNDGTYWYDEQSINNKLKNEKIDMILIDGPKTFDNKIIRYNAVKYFRKKFSNNYIIILDDANRKGEKEIINRWKKEFNIDFICENNIAYSYFGEHYISNPI